MRLSNPLYTRQWTKMFAPLSTFMIQLGRQLGLPTMLNKHGDDELLIKTNTIADENRPEPPTNTEPNSSIKILLTYFSTLTSSFRPHVPSKSLYGKQPRHSHSKKSRFYKRLRNGDVKRQEKNSIYHQLNTHTVNDENNNQTKTENNTNSVIIDLSSSSQADDYSFDNSNEKQTFTREHLLWIFLVSLIYFAWFILIAGISIVPVVLYAVLISLYFLSDRTRRFALAVLIYFSYVLLYDALHLIPNYSISKVHIRDVYLLEKKLFGVYHHRHLMTLNEYFQVNHKPFLDIFTGLCYLNWIPIPIIYSLYLYRYRSKRDYIDFAFTFLLANILGFIIYYIVPSAPPWYIELYGFNMNIKAPGNPAGFINFDQILGIKIFSSMYSKNANVFAAIPSLHAAYPLITVLYGSLSKRIWVHFGFVLFTLSVWFSAVYSRHHYVLDVLAGGTCAVTAYVLYRVLSRIPTINRLLVAYSKLI